MRRWILRGVTAAAVMFTACSKADDPVVNPPASSTGTAYIDRVEIRKFPDKAIVGETWDEDQSGPDLFLTWGIGSRPTDTTVVKDDIRLTMLPLSFDFSAKNLQMGNKHWFFTLFDKDRPTAPDDEMFSFDFSPVGMSNPTVIESGPYSVAVYYKRR